MWCARKLSHRTDWAGKPACIVLFASFLVCNQCSKKVLVQNKPWSRSDTLIKTVMKRSSTLYAQLQVAHQIEVLSNSTTPFFQGFQDVTGSTSFSDSLVTRYSLKAASLRILLEDERLLYFCKNILPLIPFTDNFVCFLPEGHGHGQIPSSLIITLGKPLKISFHFTIHPPFNWLSIIIILFLIY